MNLTAYEIALISGGFTLVGTLLGGFITYRFALRLAYINDKRLAGTKLRETFADVLSTLRYPPEGITIGFAIPEILGESFPKHDMAVKEFRHFISGTEYDYFNKAWQKYYDYSRSPTATTPDKAEHEKRFQKHDHGHYFSKYHSHNDSDGVKKAIENIENIISFTEPKKSSFVCCIKEICRCY